MRDFTGYLARNRARAPRASLIAVRPRTMRSEITRKTDACQKFLFRKFGNTLLDFVKS